MNRHVNTAAVNPSPKATADAALASPPGTNQKIEEKTPARNAMTVKNIRMAGA